jgi:acid-sensing ion channel, other
MHSKYLSPVHNWSSENWTLEHGHSRSSIDDRDVYPRRGTATHGLDVYLSTDEEDLDFGCRFVNHGFKTVLHTPDEWPLVDAQFYKIPPSTEISLLVKPIIMTTADNLKMYPQEK